MRVNSFLYLCYSLGSVRDFDWLQIGTVILASVEAASYCEHTCGPTPHKQASCSLRVRPREFCSKLLIIR
jgi:hypothetical protein